MLAFWLTARWKAAAFVSLRNDTRDVMELANWLTEHGVQKLAIALSSVGVTNRMRSRPALSGRPFRFTAFGAASSPI